MLCVLKGASFRAARRNLVSPLGLQQRRVVIARFSCMKLPDVFGVYDYAGPIRDSRWRPSLVLHSANAKACQRPDCIFSKLNIQPACTPVCASPCTSRYPTQNSVPSGSLLLSRRTLAFPASCRFIPEHRIGDYALIQTAATSREHRFVRQAGFTAR